MSSRQDQNRGHHHDLQPLCNSQSGSKLILTEIGGKKKGATAPSFLLATTAGQQPSQENPPRLTLNATDLLSRESQPKEGSRQHHHHHHQQHNDHSNYNQFPSGFGNQNFSGQKSPNKIQDDRPEFGWDDSLEESHHQIRRRRNTVYDSAENSPVPNMPPASRRHSTDTTKPTPRIVPVLNLARLRGDYRDPESSPQPRGTAKAKRPSPLSTLLEKSPRVLETWRSAIIQGGRKSVHMLLEPLRRLEKEEAIEESKKRWAMAVADTHVAIVGLMSDDVALCQTQLESLQFTVEKWVITDHNRQFVLLRGGDAERQRLLQRRCLALMDPTLPGNSRPRCFVHLGTPKFEDGLLQQLKGSGATGSNYSRSHQQIAPKRTPAEVAESSSFREYLRAVISQYTPVRASDWLALSRTVLLGIQRVVWPSTDEVGKLA